MGLKNGTVILEKDYFNWVKMFENEKQNLKEIFGEIAIQIEHVGSTSIKGLVAKPIIDITVAINDFKEIEKIRNELECLYTIKEENIVNN